VANVQDALRALEQRRFDLVIVMTGRDTDHPLRRGLTRIHLRGAADSIQCP
jgi:hypothetical protein